MNWWFGVHKVLLPKMISNGQFLNIGCGEHSSCEDLIITIITSPKDSRISTLQSRFRIWFVWDDKAKTEKRVEQLCMETNKFVFPQQQPADSWQQSIPRASSSNVSSNTMKLRHLVWFSFVSAIVAHLYVCWCVHRWKLRADLRAIHELTRSSINSWHIFLHSSVVRY